MLSFRVISIGTLAAHPLWNERQTARTGHATTTLLSAGDARVLVDPGLPPAAIAARLHERIGLRPEQVTHVFLTTFDADHTRGLSTFDNAPWLIHEPEIEFARDRLQHALEQARGTGDRTLIADAQAELKLLDRCRPAPDKIAPGIDLFPLPGVTAGTCGLLIPQSRATALITGDAVATVEHLHQGKVLPGCWDVERAMESFREAIEIADLLIPGRDNVTLNPRR